MREKGEVGGGGSRGSRVGGGRGASTKKRRRIIKACGALAQLGKRIIIIIITRVPSCKLHLS